ncbi:hypothetical protein [Longimicrobium terrae]|uniref:Uncharacterized protein n=1 Tax=Longimicrobium terrae TaxID=1639882 RepID=A0A841H4D9_9BACT|nr:hypothetical protein [Longimicrobium terrae]MBB4638596.1 hypothetical protein [Longimicrobium terrae]MBB6072766.1 hypothetical protein [Longimicrobium terrae]NNC30616.1 hypothetical protein [Longimicrobium terrae]
MMHTRQIPDTAGGQAFRRILLVLGVASIVGIANSAHAVFWVALTAGIGGTGSPVGTARKVLLLAGWGLIGWAAYHGVRNNRVPPTWLILMIPALVWIQLLLPTLLPGR